MAVVTGGNRLNNTNQIGDQVIETADIKDDNVTLGKLAEGNEGDVITMQSGEPAWATPVSVPPGAIVPWPTNTAPTGWLLCDGSAVSQTTYATLYALIGHTYGADPGGGNFILPNLKGRIIVGRDAGQTEFDTLAETGGAKTHTLTVDEIPSHSHTYNGANGAAGTTGATHTSDSNEFVPSTNATGGGGAHNNLQPYMVMNYVIKT